MTVLEAASALRFNRLKQPNKCPVAPLTDDQRQTLATMWKVFRTLFTRTHGSLEQAEELVDTALADAFAAEEPSSEGTRSVLAEEIFIQCGNDDPDELLVRFLVARQWDLRRALLMIVELIRWRVDFDVRGLLLAGESGVSVECLRSGFSIFHKPDRTGHFSTVMRARNVDLSRYSPEDMCRFFIREVELARRMLPPNTAKVSIIVDLKDASHRAFHFGMVQFVLKSLQAYYPECLERFMIVNAPWLFSTIWSWIKGLLDPVVAAKVVFIDSKQMAKQMGEYYDLDCLMTCFGGRDAYEYSYVGGKCELIPPVETTPEQEKRRLQAQLAVVAVNTVDDLLTPARLEAKAVLREYYIETFEKRIPRGYYHRIGVIDADGTIDWSQRQSTPL